MRVLVACEFSGIVRDAFLALGHEALSCDFLPTERPGPHYQGDLFDVIDYPWDLGIFHIPCTDSSVSGARHFAAKKMNGSFYASNALWLRAWKASEHIPGVCFEHPVSIISSLFRKPDQVIQPHWFGHGETKTTCLWLRNLRPLVPTDCVEGRQQRVHRLPPGPDRWKERSRSYEGIAKAMAKLWGKQICNVCRGLTNPADVCLNNECTGHTAISLFAAPDQPAIKDARALAARAEGEK